MTGEELRERLAEVVFSGHKDLSDPEDYLKLVASADAVAREADGLLRESVSGARHAGHSWDAIGQVLGVSRQAAQQRFRAAAGEPVEDGDRRVIRGLHAFNEMDVYAREGRKGWHMVGFGPLYAVMEPSEHQWEHERLALPTRTTRSRLEREGWRYVGSWFPWRYYKRPLDLPVDSGA